VMFLNPVDEKFILVLKFYLCSNNLTNNSNILSYLKLGSEGFLET